MRVQVPGLGIVEFPDDTPQDTVASAIRGTLRERKVAEITQDVEAKTAAAEPSDTLSKASAAFGSQMGRALTDPIVGGARLLGKIPGMSGLPGAAERFVAPLADAAAEAEDVAAQTKGNEAVAAVAGAIGSGAGSMPFALVPGGAAVSAGAAGLQSYESTRRDALKAFLTAGLSPEEAEKSAHRVALGAGVITSTVTGAFNRWGPAHGLGRGVERGLSSEVQKLTVEELKKSALRPVIKGILKEAGGEASEEATDQLLQEAITRWQYDPSESVVDYAKQSAKNVLQAGVLGGIAGGVIGGAPEAGKVIGERAHAIREISAGRTSTATVNSTTEAKPTETVSAPSDSRELAAPISMDPNEKRAPGTYVHFKTGDGSTGEMMVPEGTDLAASQKYLLRSVPGATVERVETVLAPPTENQATEQPAPQPKPQEQNGQGQEKGNAQGLLTPDASPEQSGGGEEAAPDPSVAGVEPEPASKAAAPPPLELEEDPFPKQASKPVDGDNGEVFAVSQAPSDNPIGKARAASELTRFVGVTPDRIKIVERPDWSHNGRQVRGARSADGTITLNASAIDSEEQLRQVFREELLHDVWSDPAVREQWNRLRAVTGQERTNAATAEGYTSNVEEEATIDEVEARADRKDPRFGKWLDSITKALYRRGRADIAGAVFGLDRLANVDSKALVEYAMALDKRAPSKINSVESGRETAFSLGDQMLSPAQIKSSQKLISDAGFRLVEFHQSPSGSQYFEFKDDDSGEIFRARFSNHERAISSVALHHAPNFESINEDDPLGRFAKWVTNIRDRIDNPPPIKPVDYEAERSASRKKIESDISGVLENLKKRQEQLSKGYDVGSKVENLKKSLSELERKLAEHDSSQPPNAQTDRVDLDKTSDHDLAHVGAALQSQLGPDGKRFSRWSDEMVRRYGEEIRPRLSQTWEQIGTVRHALGNGMPPAAVDDIARITSHAENAPNVADREPTPSFDPEKEKKWWTSIARKSDVIRYYGGDDLLRRKQLLDLRTAYQAAAVRKQSDALRDQLEASVWGEKAAAIPRVLRPFWPKAKLRRFMRHALPIAAHLNVTGGEPGNWQFEDFEQRAGFMPEAEASRQSIGTGDSIWRENPVTGAVETLKLGPKIELDSGKKGFQILRPMDANRQQAIYEWAQREFPEFQWFLDTWVDPRLKDTRVKINGVEVPIFNRMALAGRYAQADPTFTSRAAYTPDVSIGMGLIGSARKFLRERKVTFKEGTVSPGRKYETGTAREAGNTLDLLSGFNVRALQVLQEDVRKEWSKDVLAAATDVPQEGIPVGWVPIENAMTSVWNAVRVMRKFDSPLEFPQTTERLRDDESPAYKAFFGELLRLRNSDKQKMIPAPLVDSLVNQYAVTKELGIVGQIARVWARNWKAFLLLMPDTFIENRTDNYIRLLMQAHRQMVLAAVKGGDRLAFREAKRLAWSGLVGIVPGLRSATGLNQNKLFGKVVENVLPPEIFGGGTRLQDMWYDKGSTDEEVASDIEMGRKGRAAGAILRDLGPLVLEKTGYGNIDVVAKQQFAFSVLSAKAEHLAWSKGLRGEDAKKFAEQWVLNPPEDAVRRAVEGANRTLLNYGDSPDKLVQLVKNPLSNAFVAFPLFRYHFLGREIDRATAALRAAHKVLVRGKKLNRDQWASALADTISYVTLPVMGYAAAEIAGALADSVTGAQPPADDDDPREYVGASSAFVRDADGGWIRKPLARELVTANRINVSAMLRRVGIDTGDPDKDYWWHIKDYPLIRSTAALYLAAEDARQKGPAQGVATIFSALTDLLSSLSGTGQAVKVPEKIVRTFDEMNTGRPSAMWSDPYATSVPLDAYITLQALNLIPAQRQADEVIKWLDPVPRRVTKSKFLDYDPGVTEALQAGGWTGLADRLARGIATGDPSSPLPPQGTIDRKFGTVSQPRDFPLTSRLAGVAGQNVKPIPRSEYRQAVERE